MRRSSRSVRRPPNFETTDFAVSGRTTGGEARRSCDERNRYACSESASLSEIELNGFEEGNAFAEVELEVVKMTCAI